VDELAVPERNEEYLLYQTIVGAWPPALRGPRFGGLGVFRDRLLGYMQKAVREAKLRTSWASPDDAYEGALSRFITDILDPGLSRPFLQDVAAFVETVAPAGVVNGLGQVVLKLTSPGVPDLYQGSEFWDLSLVDPDNRRAVDYEARRRSLLASRDVDHPGLLLSGWRDGRIKQYVIRRLLTLRREWPGLFAETSYRAIEVAGAHATRALAFARIARDGDCLIVVVPRLTHQLLENGEPLPRGWRDTSVQLPDEAVGTRLLDGLSNRAVEPPAAGRLLLAEILLELPVAVLRSTS
jgi:(1->4)-alpha-D-glucan 1-alpha-D-glucosylmutase